MRKNKNPGRFVLVTGLDGGGKTSPMKLVVARTNWHYLRGFAGSRFFGRLARKYPSSFAFSLEMIYTTLTELQSGLRAGQNFLVDKYFFFTASHVPEVLAPWNKAILWLTEKLMLQPDYVIFVDVEFLERRERLSRKITKHHLILMHDPALVDRRSQLMLQLIKDQQIPFTIIDSTDLTIEQVAGQIERICLRCLEESHEEN